MAVMDMAFKALTAGLGVATSTWPAPSPSTSTAASPGLCSLFFPLFFCSVMRSRPWRGSSSPAVATATASSAPSSPPPRRHLLGGRRDLPYHSREQPGGA